jgi:hypothetical protein
MGIASLFTVLFKWAEYIALMLGLYGFHLSIKIVLVYRKKKSKEAPNFKFGTGHSDEGRIGAVFFERMPFGMFLLKWDAVAFFQKKLHPKGFGGMEDSPN